MAPARAESSTSANFRPSEYDRIAIIISDETGKLRRDVGILRQVEDEFISSLIDKGYRVAARSDVNALLGELRFQSGHISEADAAELGHMLNVPAVLLVTITNIDGSSEYVRYRDGGGERVYYAHGGLGARLVGVETSEVLWVSSHATRMKIEDNRNEQRILPYIAEMVAVAFPPRTMQASDSPTPTSRPTPTNATDLASAQRFLNSIGYDCGPVDGRMGPRTGGCLREFQSDTGIPATGQLDDATVEQLERIRSGSGS